MDKESICCTDGQICGILGQVVKDVFAIGGKNGMFYTG